jgi:hypothetical protein
MSTLSVGTIKSTATTPPIIQNSSGTEVGTFCRAWVNFDGTGTVAIRQSFNVSSITDNGTGNYTVNFTNAMPDTNYSYTFGGWNNGSGNGLLIGAGTGSGSYPAGISTSSLRVVTYGLSSAIQDETAVSVTIFR